jgi:hypothetical protein
MNLYTLISMLKPIHIPHWSNFPHRCIRAQYIDFEEEAEKIQLLELYDCLNNHCKVTGDKGIFEMKSKQWSPCSKCMHQPVTSWGNAFSTCMHKPGRCMPRPVMSQADACTYCMGSKVSSLSQIYLYSSYFESLRHFVYYSKHMHIMTSVVVPQPRTVTVSLNITM